MKEKNKKSNKELSASEAIKESQNKSIVPLPVTVGTLRKENTSPFGIIVFFGILIAVAFFLPKITDYFNSKKEDNNIPSVVTSSDESSSVVEDNSNESEIKYFEISSSDINVTDNLILQNMNVQEIDGEYFIIFDIYNSANTTFNEKNNYFLELYDSSNAFLERAKVGKINLSSKKSINKTLEISANAYKNAKLFLFNSLSTKDYPEVKLEYKNSIKATLTCTKNNDVLSYTFTNDKLKTFKEEISVSSSEAIYNTKLKTYQDYYQKYLKIDNIEVNFSNNNGFTYTSNIDLEKVDYSLLDDERIFKDSTSVSVVKYEMEALQYKCAQ